MTSTDADRTPSRSEPVVSGAEVAPGIRRFDDGVVNWYLIEEDGGYTALDAGFPADWRVLETALGMLAGGTRALRAVVITHAHIDHIGFAARAADAGAAVYVSEGDEELLRHPLNIASSERSPLRYLGRPATRALMAHALRTGAPTAKRVRSARTFGDGDVLPVPGSPRAVSCAGHTFGHHAFHLPDRDVLFSGDALVTRNPYTGETGPRIVSAAATADSEQNLRTLDALARTGAATVLPGHGEPWRDGVARAVELARAAGPS